MKEMMSIWYKLQKVMKSVELQDDATIAAFETDMNSLRRCINRFVDTDPPIPGVGLKLPTQLKTHIMFYKHVQEQLEQWGTLGGIDEQNIESTHAVWNQLMRQFGQCRGLTQKKLVMKTFLFNRAAFVLSRIDNMIEKTRRVKGPKYGLTKKSNQPEEVVCTAAIDTPREEVLPNDLDDFELRINATESIHPYRDQNDDKSFDTRICVCPTCSKRVLANALAIHEHEMHSGSIVEEADGAHDKGAILAAAGK
jgi:hypothetical protein